MPGINGSSHENEGYYYQTQSVVNIKSRNYAGRADLQTRSAGSLINKYKGGGKMKSKLFLIGLILVMVALTVAPVMANGDPSATTITTGDVTAATITITAPSAINLGHFKVGDMTGSSLTPGTVTVTAGTAGYPVEGIPYSILAQDSNTGSGKGFMMNGTTPLNTNKFMISPGGTTPVYVAADTGFSYTGNAKNADPINLPYYVKQTIDGTETVGTYSITITLTVSLPQ